MQVSDPDEEDAIADGIESLRSISGRAVCGVACRAVDVTILVEGRIR